MQRVVRDALNLCDRFDIENASARAHFVAAKLRAISEPSFAAAADLVLRLVREP